jgi:sugar transferase (PEP-CTERM/EpsH1 system associated)
MGAKLSLVFPTVVKKTIKILHVLHSFSAGGLENGIANIINNSPEYLEHELCLLTCAGDFIRRLNRPVVYHELHKASGNDAQIVLRLRSLYRKQRIDVIHTRNWAGFDGVIAACLTPGIALIHAEHGRDMADPNGTIRRRNLLRRLLAFRASRFIAVSRDLYDWMHHHVGIAETKLLYIPNGVATDRFKPNHDNHLREELGIADNEFVVGTIGRLDPIKNHEGLIDAVRILNRDGMNVRLIVVGEGSNRSNLEKKLADWNSGPRPVLMGYRPDPGRVYHFFDVFVLNSYAEGMSNTLLEAMACGLPIVCTPVGANVELVTDGRTGQYASVADNADLALKIKKYQLDSGLRHSHGLAARAFVVDNYSLSKMVGRYTSLYASLAKS